MSATEHEVDSDIEMDELAETIGTLCAASDGYSDRVDHMSTVIEMCHERELPANAIKGQTEMDIIRYGIDAGATRRRLCKTIDEESDDPRSDVSPDADPGTVADQLLQVFIDYAADLDG